MKKLLFASLATLAACATSDPPQSEMVAARAMVAQAQPVAEAAAAAELANAQASLARAEIAMQRGQYGEARLLALRAEADARLAWTMAENARARSAIGTYLLFEAEDYRQQGRIFGEDPYPLGIEQNRKMLEVLFRSSFEEGLTKQHARIEDVFDRTLLDT